MSLRDFKRDLRDLLIKHNAYIGFSCDPCSDTHGLTGDKLIVGFRRDNKSFKYKEFQISDGWSVHASDLK